MDFNPSCPPSPSGERFQPICHNAQRDGMLFSPALGHSHSHSHSHDSSVHEKISQFNTLAMQSKQLERKTADAALKRAMLGREEAEAEMRRYRDEAKALKRLVDEGKERERRVGERLETVMEQYGRAKETHAHTQALWERELRRTRKEAFKAQSATLALQEEVQTCRTAQQGAEEAVEREKEDSKAREQMAEQEALAARCTVTDLQEQLEQAFDRAKILERERDAFKSLAKAEEMARIAAEGKSPLPRPTDCKNEFAPPKKPRLSSLDTADIKSIDGSEAELEEVTRLWQWEKQRASRALEKVDFLEAECQLRCCPGAKIRSRSLPHATFFGSPRRKRPSEGCIVDAGDLMILGKDVQPCARIPASSRSKTAMLRKGEGRKSTVFVPAEGIFRTVSKDDAETIAMDLASPMSTEPSLPADTAVVCPREEKSSITPPHERTPSVEPPSFAVFSQPRSSLLSLLDAPYQGGTLAQILPMPMPSTCTCTMPTTPGRLSSCPEHGVHGQYETKPEDKGSDPGLPAPAATRTDTSRLDDDADKTTVPQTAAAALETDEPDAHPSPQDRHGLAAEPGPVRPHTSAALYAVETTTTKVPLREDTADGAARLLKQHLMTPSTQADRPTWDLTNPALTPTMTREQALARIRERRGRARSVGKGSAGNATVRPQELAVTPSLLICRAADSAQNTRRRVMT